MDVWEAILVFACLGTFFLEVLAFRKMILLIIEIKEGLGIAEDKEFRPGDMLCDGLTAIGLRLGEVDKNGKPTQRNLELQQALGNIFSFATEVAMSRLQQQTGIPDISKLPKKQQGYLAALQFAQPILEGLMGGAKRKIVAEAKEAITPPGW